MARLTFFALALFAFRALPSNAEANDSDSTCREDHSGFIQSKMVFNEAKLHMTADVEKDAGTQYEGEDTQQGIPQEMQDLLDRTNMYRCMHDAPALVWDAAISANALKWARKGLWQHSTTADPPQNVVNGEQLGENLAWGNPHRTGVEAVNAWYAEVQDTKDGKGLATSRSDSPTGKTIGHYTQLVWKSTTRVGCGKAKLNTKPGDFWVCQYGVPGNINGQFEENVLATTKAREDCGGKAVPDYEHCIPSHSVDRCHPCLYDSHCKNQLNWKTNRDGMFCCPFLKLCVLRTNTQCNGPAAACNPRCPQGEYPDQRECEPNCKPLGGDTFTWAGGAWTPEKWIGVKSCGGAPAPSGPAPALPAAPSSSAPTTPEPPTPPGPAPSPTEPAPAPGPAPLTWAQKKAKAAQLRAKIQKGWADVRKLQTNYSATIKTNRQDYQERRAALMKKINKLQAEQRSIYR